MTSCPQREMATCQIGNGTPDHVRLLRDVCAANLAHGCFRAVAGSAHESPTVRTHAEGDMIGLDLFRATNHAGRGLFNALAELGAARMAPPRGPRDAAHRLAGALGTVARAHDIAV